MSTEQRLPDVARAEYEASEWIARLDADDVGAEDRAEFERWCAAHPRHARAYEDLSASWSELRSAGRIVRAVSFGNAMNAAADRPRPHRRRWVLALAATLSAVAVIAGWWMTRINSETVFQTAIGEHASVELPDGSRLELNSHSLARVEYSAQARVIQLTRGEAYFKVAHEPQRPFWVVAGHSWIRAVGTEFNVDLRPSGVRVIVSEGTIKVAAARARDEAPSDISLAQGPVSVLKAGQQAEVTSEGARIRAVAPTEVTRLTAWRKGSLYFENQPLESVVEELNRYTAARIAIEDAGLRQLPVGGTFQANPQGVDALLSMLQEGFGLRVRRAGGERIYIESATN